MAQYFYLTGERKGKTCLLAKRYPFKDGVMRVDNDDDAMKFNAILGPYYGVKMSEKSPEELKAGAGKQPAEKKD